LPDDNDEPDETKLRLELDDLVDLYELSKFRKDTDDLGDLGDFGGQTKFRQDCGDFELGDFGG